MDEKATTVASVIMSDLMNGQLESEEVEPQQPSDKRPNGAPLEILEVMSAEREK